MEQVTERRSLSSGTCRWLFLAIFAFTVLAEVSGLKCYQCSGYMTNEECNKPENLKDCPEENALVYDVCESLVKHTENGKQIRKVCAKGPCSLETKNQNSALNIAQECVGNDCRYCCGHDGCNTDGALSSTRVGMATVLLPALAFVVIAFRGEWLS